MLNTASDRFERRLAEELGKFRVEVVREFSLIRTEVAHCRIDMAHGQTIQLRWLIGALITGLAGNVGMMAFFMDALRR